ncbi:MAG TPA: aspartate-semialdehyde dehydrogenase [Bacteroidales bacterium]|nr:aspartate-semialdehyde dehydrogenase [Bacteroidales bacterium]HRR48930.1 aspartate-semialdehyde dehydrogenase [Bacteroidales bacterium]HRT34228.1 aspartate-semialdehyde dehydrogenase [Bacteroidales bacterium]HRT83595.1 aspartate-semialdehyde dehydrogenase [Bacteroidales bacterium]
MEEREKLKVAVLGATGSVGQKFIELLQNHPWFQLHEVAASERSAGKKYKDAVNWVQATPLPESMANMIVKECSPNLESKILFSGLDSSVAGEIEEEFASQGYYVISNARNHRFDKDVPLMIPEVNPEHMELVRNQNRSGFIVTNPNCATIGLVMALKPLQDKFGIEAVNVVTMQAISGAGYPGVASLDILDNVIPFIGGEEEKVESEPLKILGKIVNGAIEEINFKISAQCNRVAVIDGHTEAVQIKLKKRTSVEEIKKAWIEFRSVPQELNLPSAPLQPIHYFDNDKYPQPKLHRNIDKGMAVSIGRLRECPLFDFKFVITSHNTVRGAAGGTILIAEMMYKNGYFNNL